MTMQNPSQFLKTVIEIQSRLIQANFDLDSFMQTVVDEMKNLTPATGVVVELIENDEMVYRATTGSLKDFLGFRLKAEGSISGLCVRTNKVLISDDTMNDPRVNAEACKKVSAYSLVVAPLSYENKAVGVLKIASNIAHGFSSQDVQTLELMAGFIGSGLAHQILYTENQKILKERTEALEALRKAQERLQKLALYDPLTDLPNRNLFNESLTNIFAEIQRDKSLMGFIYLDIDHFKQVNDTYGHQVGDELLKVFANRIRGSIRLYDIAARLGGDEFAIILKKLHTRENGIKICKKIINCMAEPFSFKEMVIDVKTSIGLTYYAGDNKTQAEVIKKADEALYIAKKSGRNTYVVME